MPEKRHTILIVDDEPDILDSLQLSLELDYDVLTATSGEDGLGLLAENPVALIISDQRMPKMTGVEFLAKAMEISPRTVRMMLTGFADFDAIVEAVNQGRIYRYISKPWEPRDLEMDVRRAVEAYELQTALDRRMQELATLCDIGASITSVLDPDKVVQKIMDSVVDTLGFDRSFLMLVDEDAGALRYRGCAGVRDEALSYVSELEYDLDRSDVAVVLTLKENRPILVEDVEDAHVPVDRETAHRIGIRSFVTAPLRTGDLQIGVLFADRSSAGERVTELDERLLMGFADYAAIAIENARLYAEALEKKRLEEEVAVAGRIQMHLLPSSIPEIEGFEVAGISRPSRVVSGDYYDAVTDDDGRLWLALGDVSGKGMPASLTMATLRALFRAEMERDQSLSQAMTRVSEGLFHATAPEVFATFCFGVLDAAARTFTFVNAGHPYPVLARADGTVCDVEGAAGLPAGMDPMLTRTVPCTEQRVDLAPGDVLVVYSDGVAEAGAGTEDMFGEERLRAIVSERREEGAQAVQDAVCEAVDAFMNGAPPDDDLTLVVIAATQDGAEMR